MADSGFIKSLARTIPDPATRTAFEQGFTYILNNMRLGVPEHQTRAVNSQQYWLQSTTASSTGGFDILHGITGTTPRYAIPVLELDRVGAQVVPLEVTRAADGHRIYLKSTSTSAPITLLIE